MWQQASCQKATCELLSLTDGDGVLQVEDSLLPMCAPDPATGMQSVLYGHGDDARRDVVQLRLSTTPFLISAAQRLRAADRFHVAQLLWTLACLAAKCAPAMTGSTVNVWTEVRWGMTALTLVRLKSGEVYGMRQRSRQSKPQWRAHSHCALQSMRREPVHIKSRSHRGSLWPGFPQTYAANHAAIQQAM